MLVNKKTPASINKIIPNVPEITFVKNKTAITLSKKEFIECEMIKLWFWRDYLVCLYTLFIQPY